MDSSPWRRTLSGLASNRELVVMTVVNFITYSAWTLLNKVQFMHKHPHDEHRSPWHDGFGVSCPLFVTGLQMLIAGLVSAFALYGLGLQARKPGMPAPQLFAASTFRHRILPLGVARSVDIGGANAALVTVTVATQQVIKSLLPLFVTVLTITFLRQRVNPATWASLVPIVIGTIIATLGDSHFHIVGFTLAFVSCFARAFKAVLNARLLHQDDTPLLPLEILLLEAPTSGATLLLMSLVFEHKRVYAELGNLQAALPLNLLGGVLMFTNQATYITIIRLSSAMSCQVLMNVKMLLLIMLSVYLFATPLRWFNYIGVMVATTGCFAYSAAASRPVSRKVDDTV